MATAVGKQATRGFGASGVGRDASLSRKYHDHERYMASGNNKPLDLTLVHNFTKYKYGGCSYLSSLTRT
jgi:hypothetical protein